MTHKIWTDRATLVFLALALCACHKEPTSVHSDLAPDAPLAEWAGPDGVHLVVAPASQGAVAFVEGPVAVESRAALDLEVPESWQGARALVRLNDRELLELELRGGRHRYLAPLPQDAQQPGPNRLEVALQAPPGGAGAEGRIELHGLAVAPAEAPLPAWLAENDIAPLQLTREKGVPTLVQAGPSAVRFALRLPENAELRFIPERPRSGSGPARLKVGLTAGAGESEQELWTGQVAAGRDAEEVAVPLPGKAGQEVRLALHVEGGADGAPGMAAWKAPRVIGRGPRTRLGSVPPSEADLARGAALREALAGSSLLLVVLDGVPAGAATPEIDRLAAEGVRFDHAYSPDTSAPAAMASLFTSQYPDRHHRGLPTNAPLPQQALTVADVVAAQGVDTAGFVTRGELGSESGLDRGFSTFQVVAEGTAGATAAEWLSGRSNRFFGYVELGGDAELGELRKSLETAGVWQKLVVIVTADRGQPGPGLDLSDRALRVPLVVSFPSGKGPAGKRLDTLVDLLEVAPTIADVFGRLGKSGTDREFEGRSLLALIDGAPGRGATLLRSDGVEPGYALCDGRIKLIFGLRRGVSSLFDLIADPGEKNDLAGAQPIRAERYRLALFRWIRDLDRAPGEGGTETLSPEELENLKALGYVG